jgi:hypothetical protein
VTNLRRPSLPEHPATTGDLPDDSWAFVLDMSDVDDPADGVLRTRCGACGALDCIVEVDRAERWNEIDPETLLIDPASGKLHVDVSTGDEFSWAHACWRCESCNNTTLTARPTSAPTTERPLGMPPNPSAAPACGAVSGPFTCVLPAGPHAVTRDGRTMHYYQVVTS